MEKYLIHSNELHFINKERIHQAVEKMVESLDMAAGSTRGFDLYTVVESYEGFFRECSLFLNSGKFLLLFGESGAGSGKRLFFLVDLRSQAVQTLLLPLDFELGDGQVFFRLRRIKKNILT